MNMALYIKRNEYFWNILHIMHLIQVCK